MGCVNLIVQRAEMKAKLALLYDHHFKYGNWKYWFHIQR